MQFYTNVIWGNQSKPVKTETTKRIKLHFTELGEDRAYFEKQSIFTFRWRSTQDKVRDKYYLTFEKNVGLVEYKLSEKGRVIKIGKLNDIQIQDV